MAVAKIASSLGEARLHFALTARASIVSLCAALLLSPSERGAAQPSGDRATIEEITVIGRYPGPPLWKVTSGDRTLWIFGDLSPVPKGLDWDPRNAERVLDRAGGVIKARCDQRADLQPDQNVPGAARRAPARARYPRGRRSQSRCRPDLYARYAALRARHMPDADEDDEDVRPALAALRLYGAALDDTGLTIELRRRQALERQDAPLATPTKQTSS